MTAPKTASTVLLGPDHADAIQPLVSDPVLAATTRLPNPYPADGARAFVAKCLRERELGQTHVLAILDCQALVGLCGLHGVQAGADAEIGYWIGRPFWGHGLATFGVQSAVQMAFDNLKLTRVHGDVLEHNLASRRVLEKTGFRLVGFQPHTETHWDPAERLALYELTLMSWLESSFRR